MMKKTISFLLAAVLLFSAVIPVFAAEVNTTTKLRLRSDLAGVKPEEYAKFIDVDSDALDFNTVTRAQPVSVADYAGTPLLNTTALKAGREYEVDYDLFPINGYVLPETAEELDIQFECDKGARLIHYAVTHGLPGEGDTRAVHIVAEIVVDGNVFQRIIGWLYDRYLKARAWSLY